MKKINIIKENRDYNKIIRETKAYYSESFIIHIKKETNTVYKFGFSVGKKIGNAVTRNHIKRQLKNIIDTKKYKNDFNCVIITRKKILNKSYQEIKTELISLLEGFNIYR